MENKTLHHIYHSRLVETIYTRAPKQNRYVSFIYYTLVIEKSSVQIYYCTGLNTYHLDLAFKLLRSTFYYLNGVYFFQHTTQTKIHHVRFATNQVTQRCLLTIKILYVSFFFNLSCGFIVSGLLRGYQHLSG